MAGAPSFRRRLAILGGTTTWGDAAAALRHLVRMNSLVEGPDLAAYEQAFAARIGVRHAFSFAHGRVGLYGLLRALEIGAGDEVLVPVPTHVVVANAVRYTGATPVFVDCRPDDWNMDLDRAERLVTPRTRALLLQHTFGIPADIEGALALGRQHGFEVLEDCVHALGAVHRGRPVGSFGRGAFFSTEETKTISSTMGGMAVTDDDALAERLRRFQASCAVPSRWLAARYLLKLLGYHVLTQPSLHRYTRPTYEALGRRNPLPGPTSADERAGRRPAAFEERLSNGQAALALRQLHRLDDNVAHRRRIARIYAEALEPFGGDHPPTHDDDRAALVRYPLRVPDRDAAVRTIAPRAVPGLWFTSVLEEAEDPANSGYEHGTCPNAEEAARTLVNLPTHLRVTDADARMIAQATATAVASARAELRASTPGASR
jgi:dTDP-4-amino-4,6-dideoxygalactose transaminase